MSGTKSHCKDIVHFAEHRTRVGLLKNIVKNISEQKIFIEQMFGLTVNAKFSRIIYSVN